MSSAAPDGWALEPFGKFVAASVAGEWGKEAAGDDNDIPVLRSTNFTASGVIDYSKLAIRNIEENKRVKKGLVSGDIVLEKSGGSPTQPVGRVVYFENDKPFLFSNFTQRLSPSIDCDSRYMFYTLYKAYQDGIVNKFQQQTTGIINFQLAEYLLYKTAFPPLPEQKKIASILTSVDEVIEKTESQIAKLQDLKTGMMQELLTKGIGHTEFKDSPIGRIPVGWELHRLIDNCDRVCVGFVGTCEPYYREKGIPLIRTTNLSDDGLDLSDIKFVTTEFHLQQGKSQLRTGDLVVARHGHYGQSCVVTEHIGEANCLNVVIVKPDHSKYLPEFLNYHFNADFMRKAFEAKAEGSTQKVVSTTEIAKTYFLLPSMGEQKEIASVIGQLDKNLNGFMRKLQAHKSLKKALMQDLLTGKVRVKTD